MIVTSLRARRGRVIVSLDDERQLRLSEETVLSEGLRKGAEVTERDVSRWEERDTAVSAREAALRLLAVRPRTRYELKQRLEGKEFPEDVADACVERLAGSGLVDDADFAEAFVRARVRLRPRGRRELRAELQRKGVDRVTADTVIDRVLDEVGVSDLELARAALRKWRPRGDDRGKDRQRLYGYLVRRGFGGETVSRVMEEALPPE